MATLQSNQRFFLRGQNAQETSAAYFSLSGVSGPRMPEFCMILWVAAFGKCWLEARVERKGFISFCANSSRYIPRSCMPSGFVLYVICEFILHMSNKLKNIPRGHLQKLLIQNTLPLVRPLYPDFLSSCYIM